MKIETRRVGGGSAVIKEKGRRESKIFNLLKIETLILIG
jgi:hypothetical protein